MQPARIAVVALLSLVTACDARTLPVVPSGLPLYPSLVATSLAVGEITSLELIPSANRPTTLRARWTAGDATILAIDSVSRDTRTAYVRALRVGTTSVMYFESTLSVTGSIPVTVR
jgi:Flp pilus assembly secretin CpaC